MPARLVLRIVSGPFEDPARLTVCQARIRGGQELTVGRSRLSTDLGVRQDPMMSGKHFRVALEDKLCRLFDLESRNGTYVNGKRVLEAILSDADEVRAGQTIFQVQIEGGAAVPSTVIEFGAITPVDLEESPEEDDDVLQVAAPIDEAFDAVLARVRSRN